VVVVDIEGVREAASKSPLLILLSEEVVLPVAVAVEMQLHTTENMSQTQVPQQASQVSHIIYTIYLSDFLLRLDIADHITTFGAKRPGTGGRKATIIINAFPTTVPDAIIYQYDGETPSWTIP